MPLRSDDAMYVNAMGLATPIGIGKQAAAAALFAGTRDGFVPNDVLPGVAGPVGRVRGPLPEIPAALSHLASRNNRMAMAALAEIEGDVAVAAARFGARRIAVVLGTSTSGMAEGEAALGQRLTAGQWPRGFEYRQQELGSLAEFVAAYLHLEGPAYVVASACSSSGQVFASAQRLMRTGVCDAAVVGGVDTLCALTLAGFSSLEALSPTGCNPFSANRNGITIGEGGAMFLISGTPSEIRLLGVGESTDAHHVSAPDPSGKGARLAMSRALAAAGLQPSDVGYINLHGTATPLNDAMESKAVAELFGTAVPCSSTKAMTGHTLGAAGAIEAAFLWLTLHPRFNPEGVLPPHLWDGVADPELPRLNLVTPGTRWAPGARHIGLSNSFAFGGSNVAVIMGTA